MKKLFTYMLPPGKLLPILLTVLLCQTAFAQQEGTITGKVTGEKEALSGATITVSGKYSTQSDANGNYSIKVPAGTYAVTASYVGFASTDMKGVKVTANGSTVLDINMSAAGEQMQEVTVSYGKQRAREVTGA